MRRRLLFIGLLAVAMLLVIAMPAFANTGSHAGGYWNYSSGVNSGAGGFVDYQNTVVAGPRIGIDPSPHGGYSSTTGKCKVCHAVHGAGIATNLNTDGTPATEVLLRSTKSDACSFCHLTNAFAIDPYYDTTYGTTSVQNYHSNGAFWVSTQAWTGGYNSWWNVALKDELGFAVTPAAGELQYEVAVSGHNAGHTHAYGGYAGIAFQGCVSCHSVHGAQTIGGGLADYILKNDPAKGTTNWAGPTAAPARNDPANFTSLPWTGSTGANGYGSYEAAVTNETEFCEDCHNGTQAHFANGTVVNIVTQAQFDTYFPGCKGCHNSIEQDVTGGTAANFGAFNNPSHNGRSHIMTTNFTADEYAHVASSNASNNGCQQCHKVPFYANDGGLKQATFPHFATGNELIPSMQSLTAVDSVCLDCHRWNGTDGGVGATF